MTQLTIKAANLLSYLFHPVFIPTYMLFFILNSNAFYMVPIPSAIAKYVYGLVICFTILIPISFSLYLKKTGAITSLKMDDKSERNVPFLFTTACYFGVYYVMSKTNLTMLLNIMILGAIISMILLLILNFYSKISAHSVGIGGALGTILCIHQFLNINLFTYILLAILLCGIVGSARLVLQAHSRKQIYWGFAIGIMGQLIIFSVYKYIVF